MKREEEEKNWHYKNCTFLTQFILTLTFLEITKFQVSPSLHKTVSASFGYFQFGWVLHPGWGLISFASSGMNSRQTWDPRTKTYAPPSTSLMSPWSARMASRSTRTGWSSPPPAGSSKTCSLSWLTPNLWSSWGASPTLPWRPWWTSSTLGRFANERRKKLNK